MANLVDYTKVNWKDFPNTDTPVTATNLNIMDEGIKNNATAINELNSNKANSSSLGTAAYMSASQNYYSTEEGGTGKVMTQAGTKAFYDDTVTKLSKKQDKEWTYHGQGVYGDGSGIGGPITGYNEIIICYGYDRQTMTTKLLPIKMVIGQDGLGVGTITMNDAANSQSATLNYFEGYLCLSSNSDDRWHVSIWGR